MYTLSWLCGYLFVALRCCTYHVCTQKPHSTLGLMYIPRRKEPITTFCQRYVQQKCSTRPISCTYVVCTPPNRTAARHKYVTAVHTTYVHPPRCRKTRFAAIQHFYPAKQGLYIPRMCSPPQQRVFFSKNQASFYLVCVIAMYLIQCVGDFHLLFFLQ